MDVLSKLDQANSSVHRSVVKAITECGCIEIDARKQNFSEELSPEEWKERVKSHINGELCDQCKDTLMAELGKNLFYMSALCNLMNVDLEQVLGSEYDKCRTLGFFNLS